VSDVPVGAAEGCDLLILFPDRFQNRQKIAGCASSYKVSDVPVGAAEGCDLLILFPDRFQNHQKIAGCASSYKDCGEVRI
jgi:hypothetical protein